MPEHCRFDRITGQYSYATGADRLAVMREAVYLDLERDELRTVADIFGV